MTTVLLVPLSPHVPGNGLALRARAWQQVLGDDDVITVVVPVAGPGRSDLGDMVARPATIERDDVPRLARGVTRTLGRSIAAEIERDHDITSADLIVCVRSYLSRCALGLRDVLGGRLVVDLDDDDVTFFEESGDVEESARFAALIEPLWAEADLLMSASGFGGTAMMPNSVVLPNSVVPHADERSAGPRTIVLVGNMGYQPNADGALWFIESVLPEVERSLPDVRLRVVGPGSERIPMFGEGFVDDVAEVYGSANVAVAPLLRGSGTRVKIIEAWAFGVPVVSTTVGAAGLGAEEGENILTADSPMDFARAVISVLTDSDLAVRLAAAGRAKVERSYDREAVVASTREILTTRPTGLILQQAPGLHVVETDGGLIVLEIMSGSVHDLDANAAVVFALVDGVSSADDIAGMVAEAFGLGEPPHAIVDATLRDLIARGLVVRSRSVLEMGNAVSGC